MKLFTITTSTVIMALAEEVHEVSTMPVPTGHLGHARHVFGLGLVDDDVMAAQREDRARAELRILLGEEDSARVLALAPVTPGGVHSVYDLVLAGWTVEEGRWVPPRHFVRAAFGFEEMLAEANQEYLRTGTPTVSAWLGQIVRRQ